MNNRTQRIHLRCEGSPVTVDGTIIEATPDLKRIKVKFDGPMEDLVMYAYGERQLVSNMKDRNGGDTTDVRSMATGLWWSVI